MHTYRITRYYNINTKISGKQIKIECQEVGSEYVLPKLMINSE